MEKRSDMMLCLPCIANGETQVEKRSLINFPRCLKIILVDHIFDRLKKRQPERLFLIGSPAIVFQKK